MRKRGLYVLGGFGRLLGAQQVSKAAGTDLLSRSNSRWGGQVREYCTDDPVCSLCLGLKWVWVMCLRNWECAAANLQVGQRSWIEPPYTL